MTNLGKMTAPVLAAGALLALGASPSHAVLQLAANFNGTLFSCVDNDSNCDTNNTTGILDVGTQTIGGVTVFGTFQTQEIATATGTINRLDTTSFNVVNTNGTTVPIAIAVGGTDFSGPVATYTASGTTNFSDAIGSDFLLSFYGDTTNTQGADSPGDTPGTLLTTSGLESVTLQSQAFSLNNVGAFSDADLFSLTLFASADLTAGGTLTNRTQSIILEKIAVPEPGTLALLGTLLTGMAGFFGWRRRNTDSTSA